VCSNNVCNIKVAKWSSCRGTHNKIDQLSACRVVGGKCGKNLRENVGSVLASTNDPQRKRCRGAKQAVGILDCCCRGPQRENGKVGNFETAGGGEL
jgi:hypothetical protein